ncbi:MAG: sigma-70 family RNA polymerase sigma factor [Lactobacillaceae bacterium]|jgi:RNA polymerase sigma-70 factor (ECF subfamily)|nr:sigma-70 family RNA polymerase sigma factor [Lactobacillaceae bacterium]
MSINDALILIKNGDEIGYLTIINETKGFLRKIYNKTLHHVLEFDEWQSEALDVLVKTVRVYDLDNTAKFTTFYFTALNNKAIDLLRASQSTKEQYLRNGIPYSYLLEQGYDVVDNSIDGNLADIFVKEAFDQLDLRTPIRQAAYLNLFHEIDLGESDIHIRSFQRATRNLYQEISDYLYRDSDAA